MKMKELATRGVGVKKFGSPVMMKRDTALLRFKKK